MEIVARLEDKGADYYDVYIGDKIVVSAWFIDKMDIKKVGAGENKLKKILKLKEAGFTADEIMEMKDKDLL